MNSKELFEAGKLAEAIQALGAELRENPTDARRRTFLFELLCFAGEYDRAEKHLDVLSQGGKDAELGALLYRAALLKSDSNGWQGWSPTWMLGHRIYGKRLGIVGMGRVGQAVAKRARAFGLQIHYHNRRRVAPEVEKELEATYWDSLDQMLARMDIISINCPHTPATYHLLSARRLALMKPSAYIVNTARGEVIDENALARMIENNELGGAGLDVFEHEPAVNSKLLKSSKVVVLPHMGSATLEGRVDMGEKVIINIKTFLDGHAPPDRVHPAMF